MMPMRTLAMVAMLGASLAACKPGGDQSYFPLDPGWSWRYRVATEIKNLGKEHSAQLVVNRGMIATEQQKLVPRMYEDGHVFYYALQDDGILLAGDRDVGEDAKDAPPNQYVLKYPLAVGASWPVDSKTYLMRRQEIGPAAVIMVPIKAAVEITYTVEAKDDVVKVPAGTFHDCLRVHGKGTGTGNMGERIGDMDITVEATEWFAPGVGLVKMTRKEDSGPEGPAFGSMTMELENLDKGSWSRGSWLN